MSTFHNTPDLILCDYLFFFINFFFFGVTSLKQICFQFWVSMQCRSVWCRFGKLSSGWNSAAASKHTLWAQSKRCVKLILQRHTSTLFRTQYNRFNSWRIGWGVFAQKQCVATESSPVFILCVALKLCPSNKVVKSQLCLDRWTSTTKEKKGPEVEASLQPCHILKMNKNRKQRNKFLPCLILHWMF